MVTLKKLGKKHTILWFKGILKLLGIEVVLILLTMIYKYFKISTNFIGKIIACFCPVWPFLGGVLLVVSSLNFIIRNIILSKEVDCSGTIRIFYIILVIFECAIIIALLYMTLIMVLVVCDIWINSKI